MIRTYFQGMTGMNILEKSIRKIRVIIHVNQMRKRLRNRDFSIISQNCLGGVVYHMLGLPFTSPTINMFIEDESFVKLVSNLRHYINIEPEPLADPYIDPIDRTVKYPKIRIDDIEICCIHFKNCAEAIDAWNRRKNRINFENIFVIANSWNLHGNKVLIRQILNTGYRTICFAFGNLGDINCIQLKEDFWELDVRGIIRPNITDYKPSSYKRYFEDYIDIVNWINGDSIECKQ